MTTGPGIVELLGIFERETASLEFGKVVAGALRFLQSHLGIDRASVALLREGQAGFLLYDTTLPVAGAESGAVLPPDSATLAETVRERRSVYRRDLAQAPVTNAVDQRFVAAGLHTTLSVPLVAGNRCIGSLNAAMREVDGLPEPTRSLVEFIAPRLAHAIENGLAVAALERSEQKFRTLFERVSDGILVADRETGRFVLVNRAMAALLGRSAEEVLGLSVADIHPEAERPGVLRLFQAMTRGELASAHEVPLLRADGTVVLADVAAARLEMGGRPCTVAVFRDGSERRRREQEMLQQQKMDSIRLLAAGIAHDFNNVLTGILGNLTTARGMVGAGTEAGGLLGEAERACGQASQLTRQLLTFAKGGAPVRKVVDLRGAVRDAVDLGSSGSDVRCALEVEAALWPVFADEGQVVQAVQNLVLNAVQASAPGGEVHVALANVAGGPDGDQVCLTVRDWGSGIAPEALDQVFLPFFTTKERGNGLGLAVAHSIVANHGGRLEVDSQLGQGSTFRLWLPARRGEEPRVPAPPQELVRRAGRILVMDDEALVRAVTRAVLSRAGYQVTCVEHGQAAIDAHAAAHGRGEAYDLTVLDLTVRGGMGGKEAARRILQISPAARLLVSSGYCDDPLMGDPVGHGFVGVLPKPYSANQLCEAVAAALRPASG